MAEDIWATCVFCRIKIEAELPLSDSPFEERNIPLLSVPQNEKVYIPCKEILNTGVVRLLVSVTNEFLSVRGPALGRSRKLHFAAKDEAARTIVKAEIFPFGFFCSASKPLNSCGFERVFRVAREN